MGYLLPYLWRYSVTFIPHDYNSTLQVWLCIKVVTVEQRAIHRNAFRHLVDYCCYICIVYLYTCQTAHSGLHHLRIIHIGRIATADHPLYTKPIGYPNNRSKVARVLHSVEHKRKRESFCQYLILKKTTCTSFSLPEHGQHLLRMLQETN